MEESIAEIEAHTIDEVREFYRTFYGTGDATMSIVGDFDEEEALGIVQEAFGDWASSVSFARIGNEYVEIEPADLQLETPDKANAFFLAAQTLPMDDGHEDAAALAMANYLLGGGFLNSRLATRIRQEEGLSYGVASQLALHPIDARAQFVAFAIYAPENRDRLEAAFREEIRKMLDDGFTDEEVAAGIQGYLQNANLMRAQDPMLAGVLSNNLYFGRTMAWQAEHEDAIRSLTAERINAAVRRWIDPDRMTFVKAGDFAKAQRVIP